MPFLRIFFTNFRELQLNSRRSALASAYFLPTVSLMPFFLSVMRGEQALNCNPVVSRLSEGL